MLVLGVFIAATVFICLLPADCSGSQIHDKYTLILLWRVSYRRNKENRIHLASFPNTQDEPA